ncbi:AAA family ATPase [Rhizobium sp. L245/93]|nr:AAA family ATPase [Rhizobium sp. L245/93]
MSMIKARRYKQNLTVPSAVAHCGISKALRVYRRGRNKRFLAALVIPDADDYTLYYQAAHYFLEATNGLGEEGNFAKEEVQHVTAKMDAKEIKKLLNKTAKRSIILFDSDGQFTNEVRLAADVCAVIPPPPPSYFRAAVFNVLNVSLSWEDASYLTTVPTEHLQLAFLTHRSPKDAVGRLRALPKDDEPLEAPSGSGGPTLHELAGYGDAKTWGIELARDLTDWKDGRIAWKDVDRGVLLSGPPGTGKTMFAAALARTCHASIVYYSAAQWQAQGHLGDLLAAMRQAFSSAKASTPCILFIDEIDSFGDRKKLDRFDSDYRRQVVNGFLECLDGGESRDGVVVVGATNDPDYVDPAIKRPSRLGRHIQIQLPHDEDRIAILKHHSEIDLSGDAHVKFVRATRGSTGDDIGQIVRDARRLARRHNRPINEKDILATLPEVRDIPHTHLHQAAIHEIGHVIVAVTLDGASVAEIQIDKTAIRGLDQQITGKALIKRSSDRRRDRSYYLDEIAIALGGIAAEELVFGSYSDSASGLNYADLVRATNLATAIEGCLAMGETLVAEVWSDVRSLEAMRIHDPWLCKRVDAILRQQFDRVKVTLGDNQALLNRLAAELLRAGKLEGDYVGLLISTEGIAASDTTARPMSLDQSQHTSFSIGGRSLSAGSLGCNYHAPSLVASEGDGMMLE